MKKLLWLFSAGVFLAMALFQLAIVYRDLLTSQHGYRDFNSVSGKFVQAVDLYPGQCVIVEGPTTAINVIPLDRDAKYALMGNGGELVYQSDLRVSLVSQHPGSLGQVWCLELTEDGNYLNVRVETATEESKNYLTRNQNGPVTLDVLISHDMGRSAIVFNILILISLLCLVVIL